MISPILEIKSKKGYETKKESIRINKLNNFEYLNPGNLEIIAREINKITNSKKTIFPILTTNYEREYFISNHNEIRATVDFNLESIFLKNLSEIYQKKKYLPETILELKYSTKIDKLVRSKLDEISLRLSKNSKYINSFFKKANYYI